MIDYEDYQNREESIFGIGREEEEVEEITEDKEGERDE